MYNPRRHGIMEPRTTYLARAGMIIKRETNNMQTMLEVVCAVLGDWSIVGALFQASKIYPTNSNDTYLKGGVPCKSPF